MQWLDSWMMGSCCVSCRCVVVVLACTASSLAQEATTTLEGPTGTTTYSPKPPAFNLRDCKTSFDSIEQKKYICLDRPDLFPILRYAEQVAKKTCEEDFRHELWNCSGFSLLKQPAITKGGELIGVLCMHVHVGECWNTTCEFEVLLSR